MDEFGLKVSKDGKEVTGTDLRDFIIDSNHSMFKADSILSGSLSVASGDTTGTTTIYHNLGYVPAFWFYEDGVLLPRNIKAYADTEKIVFVKTLDTAHGQTSLSYQPDQVSYVTYGGLGDLPVLVGNLLGSNNNSAYWFTSVVIAQGLTIVSANFHLEQVGTTSSPSVVRAIYYGIDEDDTSDLSGGYPSGRPKTTASGTWSGAITFPGGRAQDVKTIVQEVVDRAGWASGNSLCLLIEDNSSDTDAALYHENPLVTTDIILDLVVQTSASALVTSLKVVLCKDKISD